MQLPPAPFRAVLCGGASLAAGLVGTGRDDLFQGFHCARTRPSAERTVGRGATSRGPGGA
eukprot:790435-Rhodomonas_salina.1